jgi:hypothetical protein
MDARVKLASPANTANVPSKPESRAFTSKQLLRGFPILHYPKPDYSKIKPRINTNNTPIIRSGNSEVSGAVPFRMVQNETSNPPGIG